MALVYFDASALVKLVVDEAGSDLAAQLWDACDAAVSSRLAYAEVCAALAAANRNHDLTDADLAVALGGWEEYWAAVRPVELTLDVERRAGQLAREHALRGAGAVHLASALGVADAGLVVAVWDTRLAAGAASAGLAVAPAPDGRQDVSSFERKSAITVSSASRVGSPGSSIRSPVNTE